MSEELGQRLLNCYKQRELPTGGEIYEASEFILRKTASEEKLEELICDCGAGYGSHEGHTEWCKWMRYSISIGTGRS